VTVEPLDVRAALARAPMLAIGPGTTVEEADAAFPRLADFDRGGVYTGRFVGMTPWERHPRGDELLYVIEGEVEITVLDDGALVRRILCAGSAFVVPQGRWHRQHARQPVALLTATPTPSDISFAADPRLDPDIQSGEGPSE
jgi:mannose-6-phosphate isomerase-like protein (cupin superfamily)